MSRPDIHLAMPAYGGQVTTADMLSVFDLSRRADAFGFELSVDLLAKDSLVTAATTRWSRIS